MLTISKIASLLIAATAIALIAALMLLTNARFAPIQAADHAQQATRYCSQYAPASWRNPGCNYSYRTMRTPQPTVRAQRPRATPAPQRQPRPTQTRR